MDKSTTADLLNVFGGEKNGNFEASINKIAQVFETQFDAFSILDKDHYVRYISKNYRAVIGITDPNYQILGKHISEFVGAKLFNKDPFLVAQKGLYAAADIHVHKKTTTYLRKSLTNNYILVTVSPIMEQTGEVTSIFQGIKDITNFSELKEKSLAFYESLGLHNVASNSSIPVSQSEQMRTLLIKARKVSNTDISILITGENGVGKDVLAKFIHASSTRSARSLIQVNCSAIPDSLLESELFGYEEGAFSGARKGGKLGLFELANKGTLFLDEIGEMPLGMQAKLLTFLQEHFFYRVGGLEMVKVDVRVITATNVNLADKVKRKEFREDLYYRLNVIQLSIPPLRERPDDILSLANEFVDDFNKKYGLNKSLSFDAQYWLLSYHWPGNVRELRSFIQRLVILTEDQVISVEHLKQDLAHDLSDFFETETKTHAPLADAQRLVECRMLKQAALQYKSSRKIAKALGISHTSVNKKLVLYGIKLK